MKYDEFAFFNQQLGAMLREGIPLEGAINQLLGQMSSGELRDELQRLELDLRNGEPLNSAITRRQLPEFYVSMVRAGVASNNLPAMLTLLADYYRQTNAIWIRLKGLLVYPLIVLAVAFLLSLFLSLVAQYILRTNFFTIMELQVPPFLWIELWTPPTLVACLLIAVVAGITIPTIRRRLSWRLTAFKETKLAQVAAILGLLLKGGATLNDSLTLVADLEHDTPAAGELAQWQDRLAEGRFNFSDEAETDTVFPPLFRWVVANAGEDLADGFLKAAEVFRSRASQRIETLLYAALPISILALGFMIIGQVLPLMKTFADLLKNLGS